MSSVINPIQIGVCGWGDHDLYPPGTQAREKLAIYAAHFPVVEVDSTFYAIAPVERMERWVNETPESFRFVVKAYRELTGHGRLEKAPVRPWRELVEDMRASLEPMLRAGKLEAVLFQFPPWYDCSQKHVKYIRRVREAFRDVPVAVEFRNQSWFYPDFHDKTLRLLEREQCIHVICDEPQAGEGSVPLVVAATVPEQAIVRFHGRNVAGWNNTGQPNWRDVRYAYRYEEAELAEWVGYVRQLEQRVKRITLLFNNNSQGDAVDSANLMMRLLGVEFAGLAPRQLGIF
ncbi:DUF72 domain-containing protein [Laceyella sacchari]|jgi:uncharacterized protein YecE (DUF72 family)|uniref:DUF72 domain-containing protein n=1 Tax=Laceyella sacchari TaxID=37482 RepID=A0ABY5U394_LACSH|nr:DUF72 domain-containing protein [Laceyella sacchari]TCW40411.1 uncharacterized protein YecE (DUF72 family) [Laceyella sacchari]UWE04074.1 DUF72 domain-containing protein [Laceyella sacchari]